MLNLFFDIYKKEGYFLMDKPFWLCGKEKMDKHGFWYYGKEYHQKNGYLV